jgi:hypothetical protein
VPETDEIDYTSHLLVQGNSGRWDHPWTMSEEDAQEEYDELQERLARKRPLGFAPWPEGE